MMMWLLGMLEACTQDGEGGIVLMMMWLLGMLEACTQGGEGGGIILSPTGGYGLGRVKMLNCGASGEA